MSPTTTPRRSGFSYPANSRGVRPLHPLGDHPCHLRLTTVGPLGELVRRSLHLRELCEERLQRLRRVSERHQEGELGGDRGPLQTRDVEAEAGTVVESAIGQLATVFGPAVEPPVLSEAGFELTGSRRMELLGHAAVRLDYRSLDRGRPAWLFELSDPLDFVHFDDRGRQQPLLPGTRIQETLHLDPRGERGQFPSFTLVILATDGMATVVVALDPEDADEIAALIEPGGDSESDDSVDEVVATILESPIGSMSRSGSPILTAPTPT